MSFQGVYKDSGCNKEILTMGQSTELPSFLKMKFNAVTPKLVDGLSSIVGAEHTLLPAAGEEMRHYEGLRCKPDVVLKPANASGLSLIMKS